jgi:hypothetical protein
VIAVVGTDVLPGSRGGFVILELNGAVEFDDAGAIGGRRSRGRAGPRRVRVCGQGTRVVNSVA